MSTRLPLSFMLLAGAAIPAFADVTYISQARTLEVSASSSTQAEDFTSAPGFGLWDEAIEVTAAGVPPQGDSSAFASQRSLLDATGISMVGTCSAVDGYFGGGAGGGSGISSLDVTFEITGGGTPWWFSATGRTSQNSYLIATFERLSPSPAVVYYRHGISETPPWFASGMLTDGVYRFRASAKGATPGPGTGEYTQNYTFSLNVPSPGAPAALAVGGLLISRRRV